MIFSKNFIEISKSQRRNKNEISDTLLKLSGKKFQLDKTYRKVKKYDQDIFDKCVSSIMKNRSEDASIYASECVRTRQISNEILRNRLFLTYLTLKLENITKFGIH